MTITVSSSHGDGTLCATLKPLLASLIDQLPADSVNEITPHVEALASIVKGNDMYKFFHNVEEECHKYQNKLGNTKQSTISKENNEGNIEESQKKEGSVSYSKKGPLKEGNEVSKEENETSGKEEVPVDSDVGSSDSEGASAANKASDANKGRTLRDIPENIQKRFKKNGVEVVLIRKGNKLTVTTRKPNESKQQPQPEVDIAGKTGDQLVRVFVDSLIKA